MDKTIKPNVDDNSVVWAYRCADKMIQERKRTLAEMQEEVS